jgi:hypothetical protein
MRPIFVFAVLLASVPVANAVAQSAVSADPNTAPPSLLAPRMPEAPPPPTPMAPLNNEQPPVVPGSASAPASATPPSPAPDLGTVTAVPLPPPGTEAPRPPAPALGPAAAAIAGSPAVNAPISLAPPRPEPRALEPSPQSPLAKAIATGARAASTTAVRTSPVPLESNQLPEPPLSSEASPADFLRAARGAVAAGRNGEARSALEMAQTRLLDRVVDAGTEQQPSDNAAVKQISEAIDALVANDRMACLRYIEFASRTLGAPLD